MNPIVISSCKRLPNDPSEFPSKRKPQKNHARQSLPILVLSTAPAVCKGRSILDNRKIGAYISHHARFWLIRERLCMYSYMTWNGDENDVGEHANIPHQHMLSVIQRPSSYRTPVPSRHGVNCNLVLKSTKPATQDIQRARRYFSFSFPTKLLWRKRNRGAKQGV